MSQHPYRDSLDLSPLSKRFYFVDTLFLDLSKIVRMTLVTNTSHAEAGRWIVQLKNEGKEYFYLGDALGAQVFNALKAYRCQ